MLCEQSQEDWNLGQLDLGNTFDYGVIFEVGIFPINGDLLVARPVVLHIRQTAVDASPSEV